MHYVDIDITNRKVIKAGMYVDIKISETITKRGYIKKVLSKENSNKPLKVELLDGSIGRLIGVPSKADLEKDTFKFYNLFLNHAKICALFDRPSNQCYMTKKEEQGKVKTTIYLFDNVDEAKRILKGTKFDNKNYYIKPITRKDYIHMQYPSDFYVINMKKRISNTNLAFMEKKFY